MRSYGGDAAESGELGSLWKFARPLRKCRQTQLERRCVRQPAKTFTRTASHGASASRHHDNAPMVSGDHLPTGRLKLLHRCVPQRTVPAHNECSSSRRGSARCETEASRCARGKEKSCQRRHLSWIIDCVGRRPRECAAAGATSAAGLIRCVIRTFAVVQHPLPCTPDTSERAPLCCFILVLFAPFVKGQATPRLAALCRRCKDGPRGCGSAALAAAGTQCRWHADAAAPTHAAADGRALWLSAGRRLCRASAGQPPKRGGAAGCLGSAAGRLRRPTAAPATCPA